MRYVQRGAGTIFGLTVATLIVFWTVRDTRPSGDAVLPILYGVAGASAVAWLVAEIVPRRRESDSSLTPNQRMNRLIRDEFRKPKRARRWQQLTGRATPETEPQSVPSPPLAVPPRQPTPTEHPAVVIPHEPIRWDQISERPSPGEEPIPLEPWLEDRIAAHTAIVRQRGARGDKWFLGALGEWDVRNTHELLTKVAPDQVDGYYRGDGIPGYRVGEEEAYYDRQLGWLQDKLSALREADAASWRRGLTDRGDELLRKVQMERWQIEQHGAGHVVDHMAKQYTDAARRWGADAGFVDEPPPIGVSRTAPAARLRRLESWLEAHLEAMTQRAS